MKDHDPNIVVLGSLNMDLIGESSRFPDAGETIFGTNFYTAPGGKGANQAAGVASLKGNSKIIGRVGNDSFGSELMKALSKIGVDVAGVMIDERTSTGVALIILDSVGENRIVVFSGANMSCDEVQISTVMDSISNADALMLQLEIPLGISLSAAEHARKLNVPVIWDPAPARDLPGEVFRSCDFITPNQSEAQSLTGVAVISIETASEAADILLDKGVRHVVIKMGGEGAFVASASQRFHVPAFEVEVVDTVAAGDAFNAGFALSIARGMTLQDSVKFACAAGAVAVTKNGAQNAMPTTDEVSEVLQG